MVLWGGAAGWVLIWGISWGSGHLKAWCAWKIQFQGASLVCWQFGAGLWQEASVLDSWDPPQTCLNIHTYWQLSSPTMSDPREQGRSHKALHGLASDVICHIPPPSAYFLCDRYLSYFNAGRYTRVWITGEQDL